MDEIKLKPCPFCGGPAEIVDNSRYDPGTYFVSCWDCGAQTDYEHGKELAAERWNGRVESNDRDRPTCKIILARELRTAYGKPITRLNAYVLSCGHQVAGFEKPRYCPECGNGVCG